MSLSPVMCLSPVMSSFTVRFQSPQSGMFPKYTKTFRNNLHICTLYCIISPICEMMFPRSPCGCRSYGCCPCSSRPYGVVPVIVVPMVVIPMLVVQDCCPNRAIVSFSYDGLGVFSAGSPYGYDSERNLRCCRAVTFFAGKVSQLRPKTAEIAVFARSCDRNRLKTVTAPQISPSKLLLCPFSRVPSGCPFPKDDTSDLSSV